MKGQRRRSKLLSLLLLLALAAAAHSATRALPNPVPLINNPLVPDAVAPGSQGFTLTVNGTGFVAGSVVNWNGSPLATTFVNASQVTAVVPAGNVAVAGTASVSVVNPAPHGGGSNVAFFSVRSPFSTASFGESVLPAGTRPIWVAAGDLNGDGKLDLLTSLFNDSAIAVSLGNGDGTFQAPLPHPVGGPPSAVMSADFNADGRLDVAVTRGTNFVSVLLGNGDGTFQTQSDYDLGSQGISLAIGDVNDDGNLDLVVALRTGPVAVLLGKGDGTFQQPVNYETGASQSFGVASGDFNADGKLDLAVTNEAGAVSVLLGSGDGTFQNAVAYSTPSPAASIVTADLNGDGNLDLAVQTQAGFVSILLGNGDGTFASHVDYETQGSSYGIEAVDLNGNGKLDIIVPNVSAHSMSILVGRGDGTFGSRSDFATGNSPVGIAVGDFDSDGRLDLATANQFDNTLSVLPQVTAVLSKTYLKFGHVQVGDSARAKVTLSNIGSNSLKINKIALEGTSQVAYTQSNNCGSKLVPGQNCKITIVFTPPAPFPYRKARVKINDSVANQKIYLTGSGVK